MDLHELLYTDVILSMNYHYNYVNNNYLSKDNSFTPIYISPYGSMNYGIFKPDVSDVDTKLIVLPSYEQLVWGKCFSKEYKIPNGELCNVMDIRHYANNLLKQSINFLETLFSNYSQETNTQFFPILHTYFFTHKETIARYNEYDCVSRAYYQAIHTIHQNPTDGKKYANAIRLLYFIEKYLEKEPFQNCILLDKQEAKYVSQFKYGEAQVTQTMSNELLKKFDKFLAMPKNSFQSHPEAKEIVYEGTERLIKKNLELTK